MFPLPEFCGSICLQAYHDNVVRTGKTLRVIAAMAVGVTGQPGEIGRYEDACGLGKLPTEAAYFRSAVLASRCPL
jgi:hypothetical protein